MSTAISERQHAQAEHVYEADLGFGLERFTSLLALQDRQREFALSMGASEWAVRLERRTGAPLAIWHGALVCRDGAAWAIISYNSRLRKGGASGSPARTTERRPPGKRRHQQLADEGIEVPQGAAR